VLRIFAGILPNLPKKLHKKLPPKKALHVILGDAGHLFRSYFQVFPQIFRDFVKVFTDFAQSSTDFARILRDFARILPNQNFWWCACTLCTPTSCTGGLPDGTGRSITKVQLLYFDADRK